MKPQRRPPPKRRRWRALFGLALAPIAVALFTILLVYGAAMISAGGGGGSILSLIYAWMTLSMIMLGISFTFGFAFHWLAFRLRWRRAASYIIGGGAIGLIGAAVVVALSWAAFASGPATYTIASFILTASVSILACAIPGALTSWAFWLIRRPDRDIDTDLHLVFE